VIATVIKMHGQGYVHGNITPAHVLWLRSESCWTLIGLSNATRTGKLLHVHAGAGLSLPYTSPELAVAMRATQEMHGMRGFRSAGVTGVFSVAPTEEGGFTSDCGKESPSNTEGMPGSPGCASGTFQLFHAKGATTRAESMADGAATEALSIVADGVEVLAGAVLACCVVCDSVSVACSAVVIMLKSWMVVDQCSCYGSL
jgi:hypothetical protein